MLELSSQNDLLRILPQFYDDLSVKCLDTLSDYKVSYSFDMPEPTSTVEKHVLSLVHVRAASHLATQRWLWTTGRCFLSCNNTPHAGPIQALAPANKQPRL